MLLKAGREYLQKESLAVTTIIGNGGGVSSGSVID